jgi:hypothetical protein
VTVEKKGLASFGSQTTNETHRFLRITLRASRTEIVVSHLSILRASGAPDESPELECCSARAHQLHNGVCSIEQRQHGRHHEQEKSRGLDREVLVRFAREVIPGESMERRFAILYRSATDIVERRCLVIKVRLGGPTTHARSVRARSISMINLEYRFHANSSEFRPLVSGL